MVLLLPIPTPLMAASLTGTKLMLDSIVDEVVGNWFDMVERIGPARLRLPQRLYHVLQQKCQETFLYPVQEALLELEATFVEGESRLASFWGWLLQKPRVIAIEKDRKENTRERVKKAVSKCFRVRLNWMIATLGVAVQMAVIQRGVIFSSMDKFGITAKTWLKDHPLVEIRQRW